MLSMILYMGILVLCAAGLFMFGRKFVFSKVRINKFIPLGISAVGLIGQMIFSSNNVIFSFVLTLVTLYFFMWFMDIQTTGGPKEKEKEIKIVPKAKPNRVKHLKKEQ